jgi:acylphosphatase
MAERTVRVLIIGKVQGVGFRAWVEDGARERQLRGWVRNKRDGSVEAVLSGNADGVAALIEACETGPRLAVVFHVEVTDYAGEIPPRFRVLPSE